MWMVYKLGNLMDRRHYLKSLLGVPPLMSSLLQGCTPSKKVSQSRSHSEPILIIGAGISGLGAAEELKKAGFENITIIEARNRIGGRVNTSQQWDDAPVDLGASWIHGIQKNPIYRLSKEASVNTLSTDYDNILLLDANGNEMSNPDLARIEKTISQINRQAYRESNRQDSLHDSLKNLYANKSQEKKAELDYLIHILYEQEYAEDSSNLASLPQMMDDSFGGKDVLFPGGYIQVFKNRFEAFDVRLNQVVESIDASGTDVVVTTSKGSFRAARVVVTIPIGVLQRNNIHFSPGFSDAKRDAIQSLGMGCLNKVYLRFPKTFWPAQYEAFTCPSKKVNEWAQWFNIHYYTKIPILLAFNSGSFGRELESWDDDRIVSEAMSKLRVMFGKNIPDPIQHQITRWNSDLYAYGSYSFVKPGITEKTIYNLRKPILDKIFFAGEATSIKHPSTVHGAYLSGIREAQRILQSV